jgi:hypothetical protein
MAAQLADLWVIIEVLSIAAPYVPTIAALICTTKRSAE